MAYVILWIALPIAPTGVVQTSAPVASQPHHSLANCKRSLLAPSMRCFVLETAAQFLRIAEARSRYSRNGSVLGSSVRT